jgi:hypothetical protein
MIRLAEIQTNRLGSDPLLCLFGLQALGLAPLHGPVMRVRLFVILAARAAEEEQDRLSVGTAHAASFRNWQVVVKRSTLPQEKTSRSGGDRDR